MSGIRVAIVDDAPYVAWKGQVHAANATFHRFAAALLDARDDVGDPMIADIVLAVPVRPAPREPGTLVVDPRVRVAPTAPFDGIAGYIRRAPALTARNAPRLRRAFGGADVVLLRLPASNGLLAAGIAAARGMPRVALVVGSVADVVAAQRRARLAGLAAAAVGACYDAATRIAGIGATTVTVGADPRGHGIVSSLVVEADIRDRTHAPWPAEPGALRLAYAGRLAAGKGIEALLDAVSSLSAGPGAVRVTLDLIGDGPARDRLAARAGALGIGDRVRFSGHLAERETYLAALEAADLFVTASPAEGFPKAVLDGMAVGLPIIAVPAGRLGELARQDATAWGNAILPVRAGDPDALAGGIRRLLGDPASAERLRAAGTAFVRAHTMPIEAARLARVLVAAAGGGRSRGGVTRR